MPTRTDAPRTDALATVERGEPQLLPGLLGAPLHDPKRLYRLVEEVLAARADGRRGDALLRWCVEEVFEALREGGHVLAAGLYAEEGDAFALDHAVGATPGGLPTRLESGHPALRLLLGQHTLVHGDLLPPLPCTATLLAGLEGRRLLFLALPATGDPSAVGSLLHTLRTVLAARSLQERWSRSLREAGEIQRGLLPRKPPLVPGYDVAGRSVAAEEVGGDFFDLQDLGRGTLGVTIGDASGHGLPAALVARDVVVGLRLGIDGETKMTRVFSRLNRILHEGVSFSAFVSAVYAEVEADGTVLYVNAGHPPPLWVDAHGSSSFPVGDTALGPLPEAHFRRRFARVPEGSVLVLYTDGIVERRAADGRLFGEERLVSVVRELVGESAQTVVDGVLDACHRFGGGDAWKDDATLVVVRREPDAGF
jgi:sigma-B regulation protein RsbU (phosphoserine phosphatase)